MRRKLPITKRVKYPLVREKLLKLMSQDHKDRSSGEFTTDPVNPNMKLLDKLARRDNDRAKKVSEILNQVKELSAENIGLDGSRAVWIIALHNSSADFQKSVLNMMNKLYQQDKTQVFYPGIPYLEDSFMINSSNSMGEAKQLYGTQGYLDRKTGKLKIFPIINPQNLSKRRKKFGLNPDPENECAHSAKN